MRWIRVSVPAPPHGTEPLLVDALWRLGAREVLPDGARFHALFPPDDDPDVLTARVRAAVRAILGPDGREPEPVWRWTGPDDWARRWARDAVPRRVTARLRVVPHTFDDGPTDLPGDAITIRLLPGFGFGTAGHPSTRTCLRLLESRLRPADRVADVGAGSGILAIAAARLGARRVIAYERDSHACASARENVALNGVASRVRIRARVVGPRGPGGLRRFDGVVANIQADDLRPLIAGLARSTRRSGWLVLGGAGLADRSLLMAATASAGLDQADEAVEDGWWAAAFRRG